MRKKSFNPAAYAAEILESQVNPLDPVEWCKRKSGVELWSKQKEIAYSVMNNKLTAVKSGHGVGKSFTVSQLAAWWVDTHPYDDTIVVSTAPSTRQVSAIMWEEIRKIHRRAGLPGEVQRADRWLINDIEVGFGRKPQDYDKHAFQGIHRRYVLVILDEACGIDEWLWIAALALATGDDCRVIAIGNPDDPTSYFAKVCRPESRWNVIHISVFDSPKFTGEKVSDDAYAKLTGHDYVDVMREEVGEGSATWTAKIEGEFPELDETSTIPLGWVYRAQERWLEWDRNGRPIPDRTRYIVGADIARYGGDKSAFAHRMGDVITSVDILPRQDTEATADVLLSHLTNGGTTVVDTNGIGAGVFDKVRRRGRSAVALNTANRCSLKDRTGQIEFYNLRAASFWKLRDMLDPANNPTLCLPPGEELAADLAAPRWKNMAGGKRVIEAKEEIKKRIGRSPDRGDAVILACWLSEGTLFSTEDSSFDWLTKKQLETDPDFQGENADDFAVDWQTADDEPAMAFANDSEGW